MSSVTAPGYTLHDYQRLAVGFLKANPNVGLGLDLGLGKTACSLSALTPAHLPALVIAPKKVAETVWHAEGRLWRRDLSVVVAAGNPEDRLDALTLGADIAVLATENLRDLLKLKSQRRHPKWKTVILDETSLYKGRGTRYSLLRALVRRPHVLHVWGLTATPIPNGYIDLFAQVELILAGRDNPLGKGIEAYRDRFFVPGNRVTGGTIVSWDLKPFAEDEIKRLIEPFFLMMASEGRLPTIEVNHNRVGLTLPQRAKDAYNEFREELLADLTDLIGGTVHTAANAAIMTSKLSQINAGFLFKDDQDLYPGEYTWLHDEGINAVKAIVEQAASPVVVSYRFIPQRERLLEVLPGARLIKEPGVVEAWTHGEVPVLIAHPRSAAHGLNLQHGGHTMIWASPTWSPEEWDQFIGRLARQGQKHPVAVHSIMVNNSIDTRIRARVVDKVATQVDLKDFLEVPL